MLMDFNASVRYASVSSENGAILWSSQRKNIANIVPPEETKKTIIRAISTWKENFKITDLVGKGLYTIDSFEKTKRITIPLDDGNLLFISVNNDASSDSKTKSYGHMIEMGEILSIVDFIKSKN